MTTLFEIFENELNSTEMNTLHENDFAFDGHIMAYINMLNDTQKILFKK